VSSPVEHVTFEAGSKLRQICDFAFRGCDSLKSICLPASVESICGTSFATSSLTRIEIESGNKFYRILGGFVVGLNASQIIRYFGTESCVEIPDTVEVLDSQSFSHCSSIREVRFGSDSKLNCIRGCAFEGCTNLQSIAIPSLVTIIDRDGFYGCESLPAISFCSTTHLTRIAARALSHTGLQSITIPSSVEDLSDSCFKACHKLVTVTFLPDSKLARIDCSAFARCELLRPMVIPSSVEHVGCACFDDCHSMPRLHFSNPCRVRQLLALPPILTGVAEIPDSVESLAFSGRFRERRRYALSFASESKVTTLKTQASQSFLQLSSRTLKVVRCKVEFPLTKSGMCPGNGW
jgi:hypothetical protein